MMWPTTNTAGEAASGSPVRVTLGGTSVDLCAKGHVVEAVRERLTSAISRPLFVGSANLDHIHHFGQRSSLRDVLTEKSADWVVLLDGMPLVWAAQRMTGTAWEQLAGSDFLPELLAVAAAVGSRIGVLGSTAPTHEALAQILPERFPTLAVAGLWSPLRHQIDDPVAAASLANQIREAGVDLLIVALGKPRQERWLAEHGNAARVKVALAFGASIDFLAGMVQRAPERMSRAGMEWLYRLLLEPRRMARRYLLQGPAATYALLTRSTWDGGIRST